MLICRFCGSQLPEDSLFCGTCGKQLMPDSLTSSKTFQSDALAKRSAEETLIIGAETDTNTVQKTMAANPMPPAASGDSDERESQRSGLITPLPPLVQSSPLGQVPMIPGTPHTSHIPGVSGTPATGSIPSVQGTPQSPAQPGDASIHASHTGAQQDASQAHPGQSASTHTPGQGAGHKVPSRTVRGWGRHQATHPGATQGTASGSGTASSSLASGAIVKTIITIVIIAVAATGALKVVPQILQHGQPPRQSSSTTQPMPPTLTSCPAEGTARAAVSAYLAPGHHQTLVFSTNTGLNRYDLSSGHITPILKNNSLEAAQLSTDGAWILLLDHVSGRSAIQMIRLDGQGLQTLHCAPAGQTIGDLSWSPNGQTIAFNEGQDILHNANTYLLHARTGVLQRVLVQAVYDPANGQTYQGYLPLSWIDNTRLYMLDYPRCCVGGVGPGAVPLDLYLLDISKGSDQHAADLKNAAHLPFGFDEGMTLSADRSKLFLCQYTSSLNGLTFVSSGPSPITEQSAGGGNDSTVYTDPNHAIFAIATADQNTLLLRVDNSDNTAQNGLWKLNLSTHQETRLMALQSSASPQKIVFNTATLSPWDNVSRDDSIYAVVLQTSDATTGQVLTSTLLIGPMQGNRPPTQFYTEKSANQGIREASIVGWTTI
jgi:hypothetical protein